MKEKKHWCLLVFLHMDVYHIVRATHYCHLWVAEEWTLLIMDGTKDNMQLMGVMALLHFQRVVPVLKDRKKYFQHQVINKSLN